MNDKFDELAKNLAQSVTRRGALRRIGVGLAGVVLASLGLANRAKAGQGGRSSGTGFCSLTNGVENGYCLEAHSKKYQYNCAYHLSSACTPGRVPTAVLSDAEHCYQLHSETICR